MINFIIIYYNTILKHRMLVEVALKITLFIAILLSFYIFVTTLITKEKHHKRLFSAWQFPMLLAIFIDLFIFI